MGAETKKKAVMCLQLRWKISENKEGKKLSTFVKQTNKNLLPNISYENRKQH